MKHLTQVQRYEICAYLKAGLNNKEIAECLSVHRSTIGREIERNGYGRYRTYKPSIAQERTESRWRKRKLPRRFSPETYATARDLLVNLQFSPEQIVGFCRRNNIFMASHETIYKWIWYDKKHEGTLFESLRRHGRKYLKRNNIYRYRGCIKGRVDISERPPAVEERKRFGDMEVDTIVGANQRGTILTVNDRATGLVWIRKLRGKQSAPLAGVLIKLLSPYKGLLHTITADNGREFSSHQIVAGKLDLGFYFARPYHSWERGSNENTNGLIRQYVPKGIGFGKITQQYLDTIANMLNNRPRKRFNFLTPIEVYKQLTENLTNVAFTS